MRTGRTAAGVILAALLLSGCLPEAEPAAAPDAAAEVEVAEVPAVDVPADVEVAAEPPPPAEPEVPLLQAASGGDGDSWRDTSGREYRLGMVNSPEVGACFAAEATRERRRLVARGFQADSYTTDRYGRSVSVVRAADGTNVNVHLARNGFVDDRYLAQFRHENASLAAALDAAFAAAKRERIGLWGACGGDEIQGIAAAPPAGARAAAPAVAPAASSCHPDYATCIPVKGDGSGRGDANDLDCGSIGKPVTLRVAGVDPYRLDADGDGTGCDS